MSASATSTDYGRGREDGIRQAVEWLLADYPYGDAPDWRQHGVEWIEDRAADERRKRAAQLAEPRPERCPVDDLIEGWHGYPPCTCYAIEVSPASGDSVADGAA